MKRRCYACLWLLLLAAIIHGCRLLAIAMTGRRMPEPGVRLTGGYEDVSPLTHPKNMLKLRPWPEGTKRKYKHLYKTKISGASITLNQFFGDTNELSQNGKWVNGKVRDL